MIARQKIMLIVFAFLVLSHVYIGLYHNEGFLGGDYFSSGVIITSDGSVLTTAQRIYSDGPELYDHNRVGLNQYELHFTREGSLKGYITYLNKFNSSVVSEGKDVYADRDLSFNASYASRQGSRLTLSEVKTPFQVKCFYMYELSSVHCYGSKRTGE